jgi:uncharacterized protein (TIGR04255 family)
LDIRVELPQETDLTALSGFQELIKEEYPTRQERIAWEGRFEIKEGSPPEVEVPSGGPDGYLFFSPDGKKIVQARKDGFTFNKLKPYTHWEDFIQEARQLWEHYIDIANPSSIVRLGLRYINRIEIPLPLNDLNQYILTAPQLSPEIPYSLSGFFMRLVVQNPQIPAMAIITETIEQSNENNLPLIFDIDVIHETNMNPTEEIWSRFTEMQKFKNTVFFNSITEDGRKLFR